MNWLGVGISALGGAVLFGGIRAIFEVADNVGAKKKAPAPAPKKKEDPPAPTPEPEKKGEASA